MWVVSWSPDLFLRSLCGGCSPNTLPQLSRLLLWWDFFNRTYGRILTHKFPAPFAYSIPSLHLWSFTMKLFGSWLSGSGRKFLRRYCQSRPILLLLHGLYSSKSCCISFARLVCVAGSISWICALRGSDWKRFFAKATFFGLPLVHIMLVLLLCFNNVKVTVDYLFDGCWEGGRRFMVFEIS